MSDRFEDGVHAAIEALADLEDDEERFEAAMVIATMCAIRADKSFAEAARNLLGCYEQCASNRHVGQA